MRKAGSSARVTWISEGLEANKCVARCVWQEVSRGTARVGGSVTEGLERIYGQ